MPEIDLTGRGGGEGGASSRPGSGRSGPGPSATAAAAQQRAENALTEELEGVFDRTSTILRARDDEELAEAFEEDKRVLATGLVSLTKSVTPLRPPLVLAVHLIEPILAFGRIVGILVRRARNRFVYEEEAVTPEA